MRNILILLLILLLASKCRYKNNDNLSLQLVKTRLQKTWVLKETIVDGIDLTSLSNNTYIIKLVDENGNILVKKIIKY
jgi:hypothetical protein